MLKIGFYDGEYHGDLTALTHICEIEGSVVPDGRPAYAPLEEVLLLLEMCVEIYSVPHPTGKCFTVFIGRKAGTKVESLVRLDVYAQNGSAVGSLLCEDSPRIDCEPVLYSPDDDVVTIVRKLLAELCDERQLSTLAQSRLGSVTQAIKVKLDDLTEYRAIDQRTYT